MPVCVMHDYESSYGRSPSGCAGSRLSGMLPTCRPRRWTAKPSRDYAASFSARYRSIGQRHTCLWWTEPFQTQYRPVVCCNFEGDLPHLYGVRVEACSATRPEWKAAGCREGPSLTHAPSERSVLFHTFVREEQLRAAGRRAADGDSRSRRQAWSSRCLLSPRFMVLLAGLRMQDSFTPDRHSGGRVEAEHSLTEHRHVHRTDRDDNRLF